ncbi:MAG: hypothetical protein AB1610_05655 [Nitrospirota bacterium]
MSFKRWYKFLIFFIVLFSFTVGIKNVYTLLPDPPAVPMYSISAHGRSDYGVNRSSLSSFGYSIGNCAHCHEQHAMIGGSEPAPAGGAPSIYALFYTNHVSQTDNFCYKCHTDTSSYQTSGIINRNYSFRAGACPAATCSENDILESFSFVSPGSSHNLDTIETFLNGKWGYITDANNPCCGCHNPHRTQGDPAESSVYGSSPKSSTTRGWPVSRPSQHSKDNNEWGLWGDNISDDSPYGASTERMSNYVGALKYQAPYRVGGATYEPDGSTYQDGSNLTDYVTFCQDCHVTDMGNVPYDYGLDNTPIDWAIGDKHGKIGADGAISVDNPYSNTYLGQYVLACTDCHEPHGAPNLMLIREEVNGGTLSTISTLTPVDCTPTYAAGNKYLGYLCNRCHKDDADAGVGSANEWCYIHHESPDNPYDLGMCGGCHASTSGGGSASCSNRDAATIDCNCCHYHGSVVNSGIDNAPTTRSTF